MKTDSSFLLLPPHANIPNEGEDTAALFILLHASLNHIWHHWLLSCPGSPDRHPLANTQPMLCSPVFRTQLGFMSASLVPAQKHTAKHFQVSPATPDTHDTQKYSARHRKFRRMSSSPLLPLPSPSTNSALAPLSSCSCCYS